jgi:ACT domain-containing protein
MQLGKDIKIMKAIVTVIGKDQVGIIAMVCTLLAKHNANILNITQTIMQENFVMVMLVDLDACTTTLDKLSEALSESGAGMGLSIRIQREDIFNAMHRI